MKLFNTLTRKKEELKTVEEGAVKIYACGPTVYDFIHIGNARPLCVFDVLHRYLEWRGYEVEFAQNFTDIDDKIINKANEEGVTYDVIAERYIDEFWLDAKGLNLKKPTYVPRATENISEIINITCGLIDKGMAYVAENGDVYYKTKAFKGYGKLSHQSLEDLICGIRVDVTDVKKDPMDFVLWKAAKEGEPSWESPWGKGRPGWHIECSAMARKYLGKTIDIHGGGQDLIFPHHENEIAQSEACNGVPFANYWMHNGYINVDNKKMSKSLGNFFTVRDVAKMYGYEPIRFFLISSSYRSPINYTDTVLDQSVAALERLYNCYENLKFIKTHASEGEGEREGDSEKSKKLNETLEKRKNQFIEAMDNDLNTADAISVIFDLVRDINSIIDEDSPKKDIGNAINMIDELTGVLGILYNKKDLVLDKEVEEFIEKRTKARENKEWAESDRIRDLLKEMGITLEDTPKGVKWSRN